MEQEKNSTEHPRKTLIAGHSLIIIGISSKWCPKKNSGVTVTLRPTHASDLVD